MTVNYVQTFNIIPKVIFGNKELFLNEIFISKENMRSFIEKDTYLKALEKLNYESSNLVVESIDEINEDNTKIIKVSFFDNYLEEKDDSKILFFVLFKGTLRYFRINGDNFLSEIDINTNIEEKYTIINLNEAISFIINKLNNELYVPVGISARHVHLCKEDLEVLFGKNFELEVDRYLSQKGQFASKQKVTIKTEAGYFENVRILGPLRNYTQIEISKTDSYKLKINPPVRDSGDLERSEGITIVGPEGEIKKEYGCIIADRHIHLSNNDLTKYDLDKNKLYKVKIKGEKGGILDNVHLKVDDNFTFELHLDTDDANAFLIQNGDKLEIIK